MRPSDSANGADAGSTPYTELCAGCFWVPHVCNDFGNDIPYESYRQAFSQIRVSVRFPDAAPNLEPRGDIWPTDPAPVIRRLEDGTNEFAILRWGFPPAQPKRPPVINFRSEGRRFPVGRCLIPASHFFEFTGTKSPKSKWKFTIVGDEWFCFAGLWRPMTDGTGAVFTLLTTEPGEDVAPIHDRQMVILDRADGWPGSTSPDPRPNCCARCRRAACTSNRSGESDSAWVEAASPCAHDARR